jgi:hypothetical protein
MNLTLERKITVGDVLTVSSILITLVAGLISFERDQILRRKEEADKVRAAAAATLVKLDRWEDMSVSIFSEVDPAFIETKETLRRRPGKIVDVDAARHQLWKAILQAQVTVQQKILDDHIEAGYVGLYTYVPDARRDFTELLTTLSNNQFHMYANLLMRTQQMVLNSAKDKSFDADDFYDRLGIETIGIKNDYWKSVDDTLGPVRKALTSFTHMTDAELLSAPSLNIKATRTCSNSLKTNNTDPF